ncbi:hypothetical protein DFH09DRAFT_1070237 [Mycena vulgaris]|nr:hypothetical protein DFH09DRAFT_1070237 [Mycena vulgaris]
MINRQDDRQIGQATARGSPATLQLHDQGQGGKGANVFRQARNLSHHLYIRQVPPANGTDRALSYNNLSATRHTHPPRRKFHTARMIRPPYLHLYLGLGAASPVARGTGGFEFEFAWRETWTRSRRGMWDLFADGYAKGKAEHRIYDFPTLTHGGATHAYDVPIAISALGCHTTPMRGPTGAHRCRITFGSSLTQFDAGGGRRLNFACREPDRSLIQL